MLKRRKLISTLLIAIVLSLSGCVKVKTNPIPTITYTITYHLDGGTNHPDNPLTYTNKSSTITLIVATKNGYLFDGWYRDSGFVNSIVIIQTGTTGNLDLYAKWTPPQTTTQSTITFESNGGSSVNAITQNVGSSVSAPSNPTKTNYTFNGWYTDNTTFLNAYTFSTMPNSNITLYAKWTSNATGGLTCNAFGTDGVCPSITMSYYSTVSGLYGINLKNQLHVIVRDGFNQLSYGDARYVLAYSDRNPADNYQSVRGMYDNDIIATYWISSGEGAWQREHVWPNSKLGVPSVTNTTRNQASDIHNLRAITGINQTRSNRYFDAGSGAAVTVGAEGFYPGDDNKGDVARILFYMDIMYDELTLTNDTNLLINNTNTNYTPAGAYSGILNLLLQWHKEDPVDEFEIQRNEFIYSGVARDPYNTPIDPQGNRNPFVDYPHFAELIWPSYYA